ncbi:MAG: hypothetical protein ABGX87_11690 [Alcanivorax sp.]|nr:hypothetical protein [Alloalcanivorax marinus]
MKHKAVFLFLFLLVFFQKSNADWIGPYDVGSVASTELGKDISVMVGGQTNLEGCPNITISELSWSPAGEDNEKESMIGDMLVSLFMSAQAQGRQVYFDVLAPCSGGPLKFIRARLEY